MFIAEDEIRKRIEEKQLLRTTLKRVDDLNNARRYDPEPDEAAIRILAERKYLDALGNITMSGYVYMLED